MYRRLDAGYQVVISPLLVAVSPRLYAQGWHVSEDGAPRYGDQSMAVAVQAPMVPRSTRVRWPIVASWMNRQCYETPNMACQNTYFEVTRHADILVLAPDDEPGDQAEVVQFAEPAASLLIDAERARRRAMFFPGGGHFYTGETTRGALLLGGAAGSVLAGALLSSGSEARSSTAPGDDCEYDHTTHQYRCGSSSLAPLYVGAAVAAGLWAFGIFDAPRSALRMSERDGVALGPVRAHPEPVVGVGPDGRTEVGFRLRLAH
jgi:hypothetical protein